jgi:hypothetical protein
MARKITLESLAARMEKGFASVNGRMDHLESVVEKGFTAVAGDIADLRTELKGDIARVQEQVNSIEEQLRATKTEVRLGHLEEKVFSDARR